MQPVSRPLRALVVCLLLLVPATPSQAAQSLDAGIPSILKASGLAVGGTGVTIVDVSTGNVAYRYHAWKQLAPASNEKLFTTVAALSTLRPGFRYVTTLNGPGTRDAKGEADQGGRRGQRRGKRL